ILIGALIADPLVPLLLGKSYVGSINVFRIISVSFALYFSDTIAVSMIIYYFGKTKIAFLITTTITIAWVILCLVLIPIYHEVGAAIANLISGIMATTLFGAYCVWKLTKAKSQ